MYPIYNDLLLGADEHLTAGPALGNLSRESQCVTWLDKEGDNDFHGPCSDEQRVRCQLRAEIKVKFPKKEGAK